MPQFNNLNLPAIHQAAQQYKANEFNMDEAQKSADRMDTEYDEETRLKNTRFMAGATKVLLDLYDKDPDQFFVAADELGTEGIRRGIIDPDRWDPELVTVDQVRELNNAAMVGLAGEPLRSGGDGPAKVQQFEYYRDNVAGNPENEGIWDQANQVDKGMKVIKVPMPDGSDMSVNYDPQSGQGYNVATGQPLIVRPGPQGQSHVYGQQGLVGTVGQQSAAPAGFGRSQTPADKKMTELEAQKEFDSLKVVEQNLTMMENAFRLEPMMEAAVSDASSWNTAWGSLLSVVPGSSAKDLDSTITTIKANIGFDRLQRMRAESPTGGALGQVAVQELVALQSTIANLDTAQSTDQFKANMKIALTQYQSWRRKWGEAIMKEGTRDQKMRYYQMVPDGATYMHPDGGWRVKGAK